MNDEYWMAPPQHVPLDNGSSLSNFTNYLERESRALGAIKSILLRSNAAPVRRQTRNLITRPRFSPLRGYSIVAARDAV